MKNTTAKGGKKITISWEVFKPIHRFHIINYGRDLQKYNRKQSKGNTKGKKSTVNIIRITRVLTPKSFYPLYPLSQDQNVSKNSTCAYQCNKTMDPFEICYSDLRLSHFF